MKLLFAETIACAPGDAYDAIKAWVAAEANAEMVDSGLTNMGFDWLEYRSSASPPIAGRFEVSPGSAAADAALRPQTATNKPGAILPFDSLPDGSADKCSVVYTVAANPCTAVLLKGRLKAAAAAVLEAVHDDSRSRCFTRLNPADENEADATPAKPKVHENVTKGLKDDGDDWISPPTPRGAAYGGLEEAAAVPA